MPHVTSDLIDKVLNERANGPNRTPPDITFMEATINSSVFAQFVEWATTISKTPGSLPILLAITLHAGYQMGLQAASIPTPPSKVN